MNSAFQDLLQKFFLKRMMNQKQASPETIKSYRDTFRIYIEYLNIVHKCPPHKISIEHIQAEYILGFLEYLDHERGNQTKTINNRLAAIHAFLHFMSFEKPEYSATIQRSLMIPFRKTKKRQIDFLTKEEIDALLEACSMKEALGRRDRMMVLILYNTGIRVSELISLRCRDVIFDSSGTAGYIHVIGKGRKERNIPLWKTTASYIKKYIEEHSLKSDDKLFINHTGDELTRSGVRYRIDCLTEKAQKIIPGLEDKNISPHTFRHSTALHLLQSGVDISTIAIWLGHESINTTHKYMEADIEMKQKTLEKIAEPSVNGYRYKPSKDILAFLASL
ncbi:Site-specific recombinase XerD [Desulforamulus putei DSM 12395]|uniref:Site-specific recombinase XerD n=1 Tax=Desulforamulus putei DSM 12395 TaxID=1121429 RepID=A0A1M5D523_9FIRM|nr:tyrosine-type recombinase/integrase [Desulforamulus putei]SHF61947.1 Site-specific recombinase XerD [Desulforamulus putei DSM 12395]